MNKKVLILGGSSEIGLELAKIFLRENVFNIFLHYNSNFKIVKKFKNYFNFIKADLSVPSQNKILKKFDDDYDIIINLIGFINKSSYENFSIKDLEKTLRINSIIPLLIIRKSAEKMIQKKWGRVVNTSSIGVKFGGGSQTFSYSLSKHLNEFIPSYFRKIAHKNIYYNVIKIGLTNTKIHKNIPNKNLTNRKKIVPVKKMANPKDIAEYIYFISTNKNQFITNEIIKITGGE